MGAVRRATEHDLDTIRELRLAALRDAPGAFASTYERELARTHEDWLRWLSPGAVFLLEVDGRAGGLVAVAPDDDGEPFTWLLAMWVAPEHRRGGHGSALVQAAIAHAASEWPELPTMRLEVAPDGDAAVALYERNGFVLTEEGPLHRFDACDRSMVRPMGPDWNAF